MRYIVCCLGILLCGCTKYHKYLEDHIAETKVSECIRQHLDVMSNSDHVQQWDVVLYKEVVDTCKSLFLEKESRK